MSRFRKIAACAMVLGASCVCAGDNIGGGWSSVGSWPLIALHGVLTPDGRLLTYGTDGNGIQTGLFIYDMWDPSTGLGGGHLTLPNNTGTDLFCSSQLILPGSGKIFLAGGDVYVNGATTNTGNNNSNIFSPTDNSLVRGNSMQRPRWYSTSITLPDGATYIQGGTSGEDRPELRNASGVFSLFTGINTSGLDPLFPRNFVAPDGRVFGYDSGGRIYYVTPSGAGSIVMSGHLPGITSWTASAAMFAPGKILQIGGGSANAYVIDINGATPAVSATQAMSSQRQWVTATVLPNGRVLATGGSEVGNELIGVNNFAEIWNPATGTWVTGPAGVKARLYHSTAVLLPDATVLVAGGGAPGPQKNTNAEIYYPPYLYGASGAFASRPSISSAPSALDIGGTFNVDVANPDNISRVTLVKTPSVTHSFNMEQRLIELSFSIVGGQLSVQAPTSGSRAPPGYYYLFVFNNAGVPSVARIVRMNVEGSAPPPPPPPPPPPFTLNPLPLATSKTTNASVTYTANVSGGVNVTYSWYFDDGTPQTAFSTSSSVSHIFTQAGIHYVTVTARSDDAPDQMQTVTQTVHLPLTAKKPTASGSVAYESRGNGRVWVVNPDTDTVSVFNAATNKKIKEIAVGSQPRTVAVAPNGFIWVVNKNGNSLSVIDPVALTVSKTVSMPFASQPYGIAFSPTGSYAFVTLEATGKLLKLNVTSGAQVSNAFVGANPRHLSVSADGAKVYVSRFISPPLPGESTASVQTTGGGKIVVVNVNGMTINKTVELAVSTKSDGETQGRGAPNYLGAAVISPDGVSAWAPSKQDNLFRGTLRDGSNLNFQNTVRAISSRIVLSSGAEDFPARIDHDNAGLASAAAFDPNGVYMFVALETSREVAVVDAYGKLELFRFDVGRAPQGLVVSPNGTRLFVSNFMDRTLGIFDLTPLVQRGESGVLSLATPKSVATEKLGSKVLKGKQFFYDARDTRLARDRYISCASCHNDGGHDGRVWDLTGFGEGLRNTITLRGRAGKQGFLHWSANFDEVQDFEGQIRNLSAGTGLMSNAAFTTGTRSQPLGDPKAGVSADLDALAAYVASLSSFAKSPLRNSGGSLTAAGASGKTVFKTLNCAQCHKGTAFTDSAAANLHDIGTLKPSSGQRLGGPLAGIDAPTLRDVWATAPYLHDGSAATLAEAVSAHNGVNLNATDLANLVAFLQQIGSQESTAPIP